MAVFRSTVSFSRMNFGRWKRDYRVWIILLFTALLVVDYLKGYTAYALAEGKSITFCMLPVLHIQSEISLGAPKVLFYTMFILLICDAPFLYNITPYAVLRSGRRKWWLGECAYLAMAAFFFMLFLAFCCFLVVLPVVSFQNDWGNGLTDYLYGTEMFSVDDILQRYPISIGLPEKAVTYLNPLECQMYTFLTGWAAMFFLGLVVYLMNLITKSKFWGVVSAAFFVLLDPVLEAQTAVSRWFWTPVCSPLCWTSVEQLNYVNSRSVFNIPLVVVLYTVLLIVLITVIGIISKKILVEVSCYENGN